MWNPQNKEPFYLVILFNTHGLMQILTVFFMPKNSIGSTNDILKDNQKTENKVKLFMAYYIGKLSKDVHHKVVRQCS